MIVMVVCIQSVPIDQSTQTGFVPAPCLALSVKITKIY